jgi:hypothetical protein
MASISWASFILFGCASVFVNLPRIFSRSTWTSGQVRGDGLLKEPGSSPAFFRHSSLFPSFLPFSVIPAFFRHSCESRNPFSSERDGGRLAGSG